MRKSLRALLTPKRKRTNLGDYHQTQGSVNPDYQVEYVGNQLRHEIQEYEPGSSPSLLDVGAGTGRMKNLCTGLGFRYMAQDFAGYLPSDSPPGLQNNEWEYTQLDFQCDVLELPEDIDAQVVLCIEVLEHVPDPFKVFQKLFSVAKPGGLIVVTVPFLSLMHQAPSFFSSGLSPYWFITNGEKIGYQEIEVEVHGDYFDLMRQETERVFSHPKKLVNYLLYPVRLSTLIGIAAVSRLHDSKVRSLAGFGCTFRGRKPLSLD